MARLILLGTKWRAERNFYMALLNCVIWLAVLFFGVHLDHLVIEPEGQPLQELDRPSYGGTDTNNDTLENRGL